MFRFAATLRLAVGLTCLGISLWLAARSFGFGEDEWSATMRGRAALSETIAMHVSSLVSRPDGHHVLESDMAAIVERDSELLSIGVRREGQLVVDTGQHSQHWDEDSTKSNDGQILVPIFLRGEPWGFVELCFRTSNDGTWISLARNPFTSQIVFFLVSGTILFAFYLRMMLKHLDPSKVIPDRVRAALDTFAEGLLVLDRDCRIVLANRAFSENVGLTEKELLGRLVKDLPWQFAHGEKELPWVATMRDGKPRTGVLVDLKLAEYARCTYMVNASPISNEDGFPQGVLASFDDVTLHEQRKQELERTLRVLGDSREQIRKQNEELKILATRDPLTGCLNRRSFFESIEEHWQQARRNGFSTACIMIDVDHFKSVNDNHGHSTGDEVLRVVGAVLRDSVTDDALVCRYGGEEFCITLFGDTYDEAFAFAEQVRIRIAQADPHGLPITASLGLALTECHEGGFQSLLEQADRSLYIAKRRGRNRVVRWTDVREVEPLEPSVPISTKTHAPRADQEIPFHAVTALMAALSFRDFHTAEHSRRVADLCVLVGSSLMSVRKLYLLEMAALLHDIGKIGVPDAILFKPGPLNDEEWRIMSTQERMGLEILDTTFGNDKLRETIATHHAWYAGNPGHLQLPSRDNIPLSARILAVCDAFDAMSSDSPYRKGCTREDAFEELRRCAGRQFDPEVVEHFITKVQESRLSRQLAVDVSKQTALRIGLLMERITDDIDSGDLHSVRSHAKELEHAAADADIEQIQTVARELGERTEEDTEAIVEIARNLLDLCRSTQKAYLDVHQNRDFHSIEAESSAPHP